MEGNVIPVAMKRLFETQTTNWENKRGNALYRLRKKLDEQLAEAYIPKEKIWIFNSDFCDKIVSLEQT